jgi:hypothetical protein
MANKKLNQEPFINLEIKGKYEDFNDFYDENKESIYLAILELFNEFKTTRKKNLVLFVSAKIKGLDWDTEFKFHKQEAIVLTRDVLPYFEGTENYEKCAEIKNLYEVLTNKKELIKL